MTGGTSPPPLLPPSDLDEQVKLQIRTMFTYADDRSARVSLIQSIMKKHQEYALPSDLPKDLILEAKVRIGKKFDSKQTSGAPKQALISVRSDPLLVRDHSLDAQSNTL
ncbi:hypothetical protein MRB53_030586 [Persea americana]|uniref:Uncharacterized protein n=1 Tax=Persea americana TaxID=3435 RepID=A0ACC2KM15_PERAE|nr:hypothetical protein MRB53_030586 [Persea americana]